MILIVDDEKYIRSSLSGLLTDEGYQIRAVTTTEEAEKTIAKAPPELILLDIQLPGKDGITFLEENRKKLQRIPVIIISGKSDIPTAVAAIKLGAYDFIEKPLSPERVLLTVRHALQISQSLEIERKLTNHILDSYPIIGKSEAITRLRDIIRKAAASDATVFITGESGTGKELIARHLHYLSSRKTEPFVAVNCPAIAENIFESELFGHVKGAFTGAVTSRAGRIEKAGEGTLFLDEIGELPLPLQAKLLRVLETGEYEKVGSDSPLQSRCRIIAATNRHVRQCIADGTFREDLYYRLNVIPIKAPSLSRRLDDIPLLVRHFLYENNAKSEFTLSSEAMGVMASYDWPGNIRQLKNFVRQIILECSPGEISAEEIMRLRNGGSGFRFDIANVEGNRLTEAVRQFERGYLSDLYEKQGGNIAAMARFLGMDRGNLSRKLKSLKIM